MNSYLQIAQSVLQKSRQPLSAREILDAAYRLQLVPEHLFGKTQYKTLQARLSEDLLRNRKRTIFARTGPGRFVLREQLCKKKTDNSEYVAPLRAYQLKQFDVICAAQEDIDTMWTAGATVAPFSGLAKAFTRQLPLLEVEKEPSLVHIRLLVTIKCLDRFLSLNSTLTASETSGRSLGFSGYLKGMDADLFSIDSFGFDEASRRTLTEQTTLPKDDLCNLTSLIADHSLQCIKRLDQDEAGKSVVLLTSYECPEPDRLISHIPTHRSPRWVQIPSEINNRDSLEPVSRAIVDNHVLDMT
ncbi:winged helix-turn-helix domain-containing protein [Roseovarius sp. EL26]|uniref:winged helix-turn-helix domain-containing protein n=1 Tax=Roseovarius sp. EL26 TaxID=2126672 RepID=UPI000EA409A4|nr:winged helix-turn-helix domain-containing protein [Roseovarius sp. EL26]